ncbi:MAG: amidohydrolase family protein [Gemmatimonadaceae bacterium]
MTSDDRRFDRCFSRVRSVFRIGVACSAAALDVRGQVATSSATIAIVGASVVTMERDGALNDATVLVRDGRILAVGRRSQVQVPSGAQRIDGTGKWLMPGLVDAHVHLDDQDDSVNRTLVQTGLAKGVTTVLEMAGSPASLRMREAIRSGRLDGPVIFSAGLPANTDTMTRAGGIRFVDEHRAAGYDYIKVYNFLSKEGFRGILFRARQIGMPVVGHVVRSMDLEGTLGSGQHGIVHMEEFLYSYFSYRNSDTLQIVTQRLDTTAIPYLATITKHAGIWVTPTLVMFESILDQAENVDRRLARPENRYIPEAIYRARWAVDTNAYIKRFVSPIHIVNLRAALAYQKRLTTAFYKAGVPLLVGTDAPTPAAVPGFSVHEELANFVAAGMTPYDALRAATWNAADYLGRPGEFGIVKAGARADLLLLEANPLQDVANAAKIAGVMSQGRWLPRERLEAMLITQR